MARRAKWRRLPEDARGGLSLLRRGLCESMTLPKVQVVLGVILGGTLGLVLLALLVISVTHRHLEWLFLGFLAFMGFFAIAAILFDHPKKRPNPLSSALLPLPAPNDTFLVHLSIRYQGALTGMDNAVASFGDGWLHVEGRRTSFSLVAEDGRAEWCEGALRIAFPDGQCLDLWLASGNGHLPKPSHSVMISRGIMPWLAPNNSLSGAGAYFYQATNLWIADRERPEGESILPPFDVHPVARTGRTITGLLGGIGLALGALALIWLGKLSFEFASLALVALGAAECLWVLSVRANRTQTDQTILEEANTRSFGGRT